MKNKIYDKLSKDPNKDPNMASSAPSPSTTAEVAALAAGAVRSHVLHDIRAVTKGTATPVKTWTCRNPYTGKVSRAYGAVMQAAVLCQTNKPVPGVARD